MKALLQRVTSANVAVDGERVGEIEQGLLVLLGIGCDDSEAEVARLAAKIPRLRIFDDEAGKMNLSLSDVRGEMLVVSQFTLFADAKKGNRPAYTRAAPPDVAVPLYEKFIRTLRDNHDGKIASGLFGAEMKVALVNDGPVTVMLDTDEL